jgi:hypothetical protein
MGQWTNTLAYLEGGRSDEGEKSFIILLIGKTSPRVEGKAGSPEEGAGGAKSSFSGQLLPQEAPQHSA